MAIILEGPDAAGKSTLAKVLTDLFGWNFYSSGGAPKNDAQMHDFLMEQEALCYKRDYILDRVTAISHQIYHRPNDPILAARLYNIINYTNSIIIYCRPPNDVLMRPEKHQWKDYDTEEHKQFILNNQHILIEKYDEFMKDIPHLTYDWTDPDCLDIVNTIYESQQSTEGFIHAMNVISMGASKYEQ